MVRKCAGTSLSGVGLSESVTKSGRLLDRRLAVSKTMGRILHPPRTEVLSDLGCGLR
jgi:hypothetical protein